MITGSQMLVLRKIATNELARNMPTYDRLKKKTQAMENKQNHLIHLSHREMNKRNLFHLLDLIKILAAHIIEHHDLC